MDQLQIPLFIMVFNVKDELWKIAFYFCLMYFLNYLYMLKALILLGSIWEDTTLKFFELHQKRKSHANKFLIWLCYSPLTCGLLSPIPLVFLDTSISICFIPVWLLVTWYLFLFFISHQDSESIMSYIYLCAFRHMSSCFSAHFEEILLHDRNIDSRVIDIFNF